MADGITKDDLSDVFAKFFGNEQSKSLTDPKDFEKFKDQLKKNTEELRKSLPSSKQLNEAIRGQTRQYLDGGQNLKSLNKQLEEAKTAWDSAAKAGKSNEAYTAQQKYNALESIKNENAKALAIVNAKVGTQNFAVGLVTATSTILRGVFDFAKSLQSGAGGVESATAFNASRIRAAGEIGNTIGGIIGGVGTSMMAFGGWVGAAGVAVKLLGDGVSVLSGKLSKYTEEAAKYLGDEILKTQKSYREITSSGAILAGGMTELRQRAFEAGLDVGQLATVVKDSKNDFAAMGTGLGEATKRIAGVSKELRTSDLGVQLYKLGYSFEEQASLSASLMANQRAAGMTRVQSDKEIAAQTAAYGKDLKILADITGQDAKAAAEKARVASMQADIMNMLSPEDAKRFQGQLRGMAPILQKGFIEYVASGGKAITNAATNVMISQQPEVLRTIQMGYKNIFDATKDEFQVRQLASEQNARLGEAERERLKRPGAAAINLANTLSSGASAITKDVSDFGNALLLQTQATEEAVKTAKKNADLSATNLAPLDNTITEIETETQRLKAALGGELTSHITDFAKTLKKGIETVDSALKRLGLFENPENPELPTNLNALANIPIMGDGGVTKGLSFAGEAGPEAVIPLPNNRKVPVQFDFAKALLPNKTSNSTNTDNINLPAIAANTGTLSLATNNNQTIDLLKEQIDLMKQFISKSDDHLEALRDSKYLQQQLVNNTYS